MYAKFEKIYHQKVTQKLIARFETDRETERQTDKQRRRVDKSIGKKKVITSRPNRSSRISIS